MPASEPTPEPPAEAAATAPAAESDPRVLRTRSSIVETFNGLVLERPYDRVGVSEVASRAGVGRSTFYEHFRDKDELLREAVRGMLRPLALAAGTAAGEPTGRAALLPRIVAVLRHLVEERAVTLALLQGPGCAAIEQALADLLRVELPTHRGIDSSDVGRADSLGGGGAAALARQLACLQLGFLRGWLEGERPLPSRTGPGRACVPVDGARWEPAAIRFVAISQAFARTASTAQGSERAGPDAAY